MRLHLTAAWDIFKLWLFWRDKNLMSQITMTIVSCRLHLVQPQGLLQLINATVNKHVSVLHRYLFHAYIHLSNMLEMKMKNVNIFFCIGTEKIILISSEYFPSTLQLFPLCIVLCSSAIM